MEKGDFSVVWGDDRYAEVVLKLKIKAPEAASADDHQQQQEAQQAPAKRARTERRSREEAEEKAALGIQRRRRPKSRISRQQSIPTPGLWRR